MNTMCALLRRKTLLSWCSLYVVPCRGKSKICKSKIFKTYTKNIEDFVFLTCRKIFVRCEVLPLAIKLQIYIYPSDYFYQQHIRNVYLKLIYFNCSKMYSLTLSIQVSEGKYTPQRISIVMVNELEFVHVKTWISIWIVTFCEQGASKCVKMY